jgi:hypothetical protein
VVIDDLNVVGVAPLPTKADAPLVIDPDTVLASSIALQQLQTVSRRDPQVLEGLGSMEHPKLS